MLDWPHGIGHNICPDLNPCLSDSPACLSGSVMVQTIPLQTQSKSTARQTPSNRNPSRAADHGHCLHPYSMLRQYYILHPLRPRSGVLNSSISTSSPARPDCLKTLLPSPITHTAQVGTAEAGKAAIVARESPTCRLLRRPSSSLKAIAATPYSTYNTTAKATTPFQQSHPLHRIQAGTAGTERAQGVSASGMRRTSKWSPFRYQP